MPWLYKLLVLVLILLSVASCEDRFRYPCQDPTNWDKAECKPPICTATATCPNDLIPPPRVNQ